MFKTTDGRWGGAVLRYIHQNPIRAGVVKSIDEYRFSSYNNYTDADNDFVDCDFALSLMQQEELIAFNNENNDDICLDIDPKEFRINDSDARKIIKKISKCDNATDFQALPQEHRDRFIKGLKEKGLSIRQISRLTGISKGVVERIH